MTTKAKATLEIRGVQPQDMVPVIRCNERNLPEKYPLVFWSKLFTDFKDLFYVLVETQTGANIKSEEKEDYPRVLGYIVSSPGLIISLAVDEEYRRQGWGQKLLQTLLASARLQLPLKLTVRKSNESAISLYQKCQFRSAGILKNYYHDPAEDALLMDYCGSATKE